MNDLQREREADFRPTREEEVQMQLDEAREEIALLKEALHKCAFQQGRIIQAAEMFRTYAVTARCPGGERSYRAFWKQLYAEINTNPLVERSA